MTRGKTFHMGTFSFTHSSENDRLSTTETCFSFVSQPQALAFNSPVIPERKGERPTHGLRSSRVFADFNEHNYRNVIVVIYERCLDFCTRLCSCSAVVSAHHDHFRMIFVSFH